MAKKPNIQKVILKNIAERPAVSIDSIKSGKGPKEGYALTRSVKNLVEAGYVELYDSGRENYLKITKKGKAKLNTILLQGEDALVPSGWDGLWRIIILDIPEDRKNERESLRYLLKKANFVCVKNTVWISPLPYEHLFTNIKKDLGLSTELMIIVTDKLDEETNKAFLQAVRS